jgi:hypothetical protein
MSIPKMARYLATALVAFLVAASCRPDSPTGAAPGPQYLHETLGGATGLLKCSPLPYASESQLIGPSGGRLEIGPHSLRIPPGALSAPTLITGEAPSDSVNSVRLFPEGLQFARPVVLTMSYANCNLLTRTLPKRIAYTTEALLILEYLPSLDDFDDQQVIGRLKHFSRYAVAW